MSGFVNRLNLRPQERRLLVIVATVVVFLLNYWFVWPHFQDLKRVRTEHEKALTTLADYKKEVAKQADYRARLAKLEEQGSAVLPAEQSIQFLRAVQDQANRTGVTISRYGTPTRSTVNTNAFFEEQTMTIEMQSIGPKELVDFLYRLGVGNSMIRVRDLNVHPDASQSRLACGATLIASYQKPKKIESKSTMPATNRPAGRKP
jgi:Tfp pilus assembly protein PilO